MPLSLCQKVHGNEAPIRECKACRHLTVMHTPVDGGVAGDVKHLEEHATAILISFLPNSRKDIDVDLTNTGGA